MTTNDRAEVALRDRRPTIEMLLLATPLAAILSAGIAFASPTGPKVERLIGEKTVSAWASAERPAVAVALEPVGRKKPAVVRRRPQLGTAKLVFRVPDGALVWLGKRRLGKAPIAPRKIVEGRHRLRVRLDDATFTEWIDVPAGTTITYRFALSMND